MQPGAKDMTTKKDRNKKRTPAPDRDTMRPEYDFSKGTRGVTAARYAKGTNVVVIDPDLQPFFPTAEAVNDALREPASIAKRAGAASRRRRPI